MSILSTTEDRRRRSRNYVFIAFGVLVLLWTFKLSFPQYTIIPSFQPSNTTLTHSSSPLALDNTTGPNGGTPKSKPKGSTSVILQSDSFNGTIGSKAAVIIETRFRTNLIPLILHFGTVLGPTWPILIYTSAESVAQFSASAALNRYLKAKLIQIRILPQTVLFTNSNSVNAFMTKSWLWESLDPVEHVLLFQSDSMLCANAARSVEDYFAFDFVGAPIATHLGTGYNGGLSLRKRSTIMRILEAWNWEETQKEGDRFEDQWFFNRMKELQAEEVIAGIEPEQDGAINLPSMEVARTFSVETIDYPHPLGVHQVHRWLGEQMLSLDEWCPGVQVMQRGSYRGYPFIAREVMLSFNILP